VSPPARSSLSPPFPPTTAYGTYAVRRDATVCNAMRNERYATHALSMRWCSCETLRYATISTPTTPCAKQAALCKNERYATTHMLYATPRIRGSTMLRRTRSSSDPPTPTDSRRRAYATQCNAFAMLSYATPPTIIFR
ncbi:unnamed protein product, partial [Laminaria digitata]